MRNAVIAVVIAISAGLVAAPLIAARSSSSSSRADAGTDAGPDLAIKSTLDDNGPITRTVVHSKDGGPDIVYVGDRKPRLRNTPDPVDGGTVAAGPSVADLQQQIAALQARTAALQQQQQLEQNQVQLLSQMNDQLRTLNAQIAASQSQQSDQSAAADARQAQLQGAINGLGPALDSLASGNGQIGDALDAADQAFPPQAKRDIAAARDAINTSNFGLARQLIQNAVGDAQAGR